MEESTAFLTAPMELRLSGKKDFFVSVVGRLLLRDCDGAQFY
jgi:hypothetical protein